MSPQELEAADRLIELAVREDLGGGDLTAGMLTNAGARGSFELAARQRGVLAGVDLAERILQAYDDSIEIEWERSLGDGVEIGPGTPSLATIRGPLGPILSAERVLLNFLQRLCGVATLTRAYADAVAGTGASILDTRKTTPGWRRLEKYAVRCGGGANHREGLYDAVLIKDNHLAGTETERIAAAVFDMLNRLASAEHRPKFVEVEADDVGQLDAILKVVGVDVVLVDNFSVDELRRAVELRDRRGLRGKVALEASGGITLQSVRAVAETGVERISVGALTHSAPALDLSLERA